MSAPPKRALGRGLAALLGESAAPVERAHAEVIVQVPVERIRPNPYQPRKHFDAQALEDLQRSIGEHGVLVPILLRERGEGYELIAGERRWRACAALGRAHVPAIVRPSNEIESLEVAIVENLQRENLNALEEAAGIAQLIDAHDFTQEQVAQRLGKSRPAVANALRLLGLSEPIKALLAQGALSAAHARTLLAAPEPSRLELARRCASDGLSVRALERIVEALARPPDAKRPRAAQLAPPDDRDFEARMRTKFGAPIALRRSGGGGGSIEIRFANEPDLIRIAELLLEE